MEQEPHPVADVPIVRRSDPIVLVSGFDRWMRYVLIALCAVAIGLLLILIVEMNAREQQAYEDRAVECRVLVALGVDLDPDGSCFHPEVLRYYDPNTGRSR